MQSISVFLDIAFYSFLIFLDKIADFRCKNAEVSRTQGGCQVIHIFFRSTLGKV